MNTSKLRYIFTDYKNIRSVKFKKLEKICQKLFILIDASEEYIPLSLVRNIQRFGKAAKWIPIQDNEHSLEYHIIYLMGKMHSKIDKEIEFAILSENEELNSVIKYISADNRKCLRIRIKTGNSTLVKTNVKPNPTPVTPDHIPTNQNNKISDNLQPRQYGDIILSERDLLIKASHATIERLQLLGAEKRPFNRDALYDYIQFNNQQWAEKTGNAESMMDYLTEKGYIKFIGDVIHYHLPTIRHYDPSYS